MKSNFSIFQYFFIHISPICIPLEKCLFRSFTHFHLIGLFDIYVYINIYIYIIFAAAAKSLQSCPTLCDPIDGSPPGSFVPGILQSRTLKWVAISFSNVWKWKVKVKSHSHVRLFVTPWMQPTRLLRSMGFFQARVLEWVAIAFSI